MEEDSINGQGVASSDSDPYIYRFLSLYKVHILRLTFVVFFPFPLSYFPWHFRAISLFLLLTTLNALIRLDLNTFPSLRLA